MGLGETSAAVIWRLLRLSSHDEYHLPESQRVTFVVLEPWSQNPGRYQVILHEANALQAAGAAAAEAADAKTLIAESYAPPDPGPYPQDKPPENQVRFTPVQVLTFPVSPRCYESLKYLETSHSQKL